MEAGEFVGDEGGEEFYLLFEKFVVEGEAVAFDGEQVGPTDFGEGVKIFVFLGNFCCYCVFFVYFLGFL